MAEIKSIHKEPETAQTGPPPPDFNQIIQTFWLQAMMCCGKVMNPVTRKYEKELRMAQYHIGVLEVLEKKTRNNLTENESRVLVDLLDQARMAYVDACDSPKSEKKADEKPAADEGQDKKGEEKSDHRGGRAARERRDSAQGRADHGRARWEMRLL